MTEKCAICGRDAGYFIDYFDPELEKRSVITLCYNHEKQTKEVIETHLEKARAAHADL